MRRFGLSLSATLCAALSALADNPTLPGVGAAMQEMVAKHEIAGAVTIVVTKDKLVHLESTGLADVAAKRPIAPACGSRAALENSGVIRAKIPLLDRCATFHGTAVAQNEGNPGDYLP